MLQFRISYSTMNQWVIVIALAVCAALAAGQSGPFKSMQAGMDIDAMRIKIQERLAKMNDPDPKMCRKPIAEMESCCAAPEIFNKQDFESCPFKRIDPVRARQWMASNGGAMKDMFGPGGVPPPPMTGGTWGSQAKPAAPQAPAAFKEQAQGPSRARGIQRFSGSFGGMAPMGPHGMGPMGPSPCAVDCIFKNKSLLNDDGSINVERTVNFIKSSNISASWVPSVQAGVEECAKGVASANMSGMATPPPFVPQCNHTSKLFMICMRRYFLSNCAADAAKKNGENCTAKVENLKNCDPFRAPKYQPGGMMSPMAQSGNSGGMMQKFGDKMRGAFKRVKQAVGKADAPQPVASASGGMKSDAII